ncbi:hypothetical protein [Nonomuraea jiangxiensis]|uniref:Protein kinase domain-containing protein n=1 Tax=Nonomuraea jiangxiensis TaxID=633440 RepID=A0A1G8ZXD0_9ACTN|nr:hypothetical protein [Nonomuraea jiangxiensis]SDK19789.1 hypothetical protein SAMN05421869_114210 [Nonomuraea jiangxiensis]
MCDRLGDYWLGARLDGGGQVVVREAYDESGTRHALAVVPPGAAASAQAAGHVRSLSIAKLTEARLDGEPAYLVTEYIEGPTLRQVVDGHGPYAGDDLYRLAAATATALAAVHEAGAVHGALTPEKVVLGAEGPRLVGLGLARDGAGTAEDVLAWGRLLVFAAYGSEQRLGGGERLDRPLRGLVAAALHPDPERRPNARHLLMSLLDSPQSQQGRLLPPEPIDDPPLGVRAEAVYRGLAPGEQDVVPDVFLRLVGVDSDGVDTVTTASREELVAGRSAEEAAAIDRVLAAYEQAGLITHRAANDEGGQDQEPEPDGGEGAGDATVGGTDGAALGGAGGATVGGMAVGVLAITHAGLLRAWTRLHEWLDSERDGLAVHRELARAARRWEAAGRRETALWRGEPLDRALAWAASGRRRVTLSAGEQTFLDAGLGRVRRRSRRRWALMAGLLTVVVLLALWQAGAADGRLDQTMAKVAASRAEALRLADPVTARKLSLAAWRLAPIPEARRALTATDAAVEVFADPHAGPRSLHALSADGGRLAALEEGTLRLYDVNTGRELARTAGPEQSVRAMAWSPDGRTLALVGVDRSYLWDVSGPIVGPPFGRGLGAPGEQSAWFSPGGGLLFAAARQSGERWAWDLRAGRAVYVNEYVVVGPGDRTALVFDGRRSEVRDRGRVTAAPWLGRMPWEYTTFAPDGKRVAIAEETGIQVYWLDGVPTQYRRLRPSPGYPRFSPDGRLLTSTDHDRVRVWRLSDGTLLADRQVPASGADRPAQATFTADGRRVRVLAGRGVVLTVELEPGPSPADPAAHICSRYGGLSPQEWARYLPELPYHDAC